MERAYFEGNRRRFWAEAEGDGVLVLWSGQSYRRSADENYPFYAHRDFVYFTGLTKENLIYLGVRRDGKVQETLFLPAVDPMKERWTGRMLRPEQVMDTCGITETANVEDFQKTFTALMAEKLPLLLDIDPPADDQPKETAQQFAEEWQDKAEIRDCHHIFVSLRMVKQPCEIEALRRAIDLTGQGIQIMWGACYGGLYEYQLRNVFDSVVADQAQELAFDTIVAAGKNALCLHYPEQDAQVKNGDMVLIDLGAKTDFMCADISRVFPVSGHFTERQKAMHEASLSTITYLCERVKPGMTLKDVERLGDENLQVKLSEMGLLTDGKTPRDYRWHAISHHLGLDTHDICDRNAPFVPGMVITMEVGVYVTQWGEGVRIEDDILITETGCENLSLSIPRTVAEIEDLMNI